MRVDAVAGHKDAGKTSLVETLLAAFDADQRVATVKSLHHDVTFDTPGSDTHRHRSGGAETVIGLTPSMAVEFRTGGKDDGVTVGDQLAHLAERGLDWVVVEGFKGAALPTIVVGEIEAAEIGGQIICRVPDGTAVDGAEIRHRIETVPEWRPKG
jgi:molybdopterin-guanine dinucleotide biosynthesis protein B